MANCPKCGAPVPENANFCGACGSSISLPPNPPPITPIIPPPSSGGGGLAPNVAAMLCYTPLCFIGLICSVLFGFLLDPYKNNSFIRFHAWQSLAFQIILVVLWFGFGFCAGLLAAVIHFFAILLIPVYFILGLGALIISIFMMLKANGNQAYRLPLIGDWSAKQAGL